MANLGIGNHEVDEQPNEEFRGTAIQGAFILFSVLVMLCGFVAFVLPHILH